MKKSSILLCLSAAILSSCCIVHTGKAVENVGRSLPIDTRLIPCHPCPQELKKHEYTTYTKGDTVYVEIEVKYQSARNRWITTNSNYRYLHNEQHPLFYADCNSKHEGDGIYYAVFKKCKKHHSISNSFSVGMIPQKDFNPEGCRRSVVTLPYSAQDIVDRHLQERTTWYNTALIPLSWVGYVAGVPLSYVASPLYALFAPMGINVEYL